MDAEFFDSSILEVSTFSCFGRPFTWVVFSASDAMMASQTVVDNTIVYSVLKISINRHSMMIYHGDKIDI